MDTLQVVAEGLDSGLPDSPPEWIGAVLSVLWGVWQMILKTKARRQAERLTKEIGGR